MLANWVPDWAAILGELSESIWREGGSESVFLSVSVSFIPDFPVSLVVPGSGSSRHFPTRKPRRDGRIDGANPPQGRGRDDADDDTLSNDLLVQFPFNDGNKIISYPKPLCF